MRKFKPGVSFGDFVITDWQAKKPRVREEVMRDYRRGWLVWLTVLVAFGVILVRLAALQVLFGGRYALLADENRIRQVRLAAPRGEIVDRNGQVLVQNKQVSVADPSLKISVEQWRRDYPLGEAAAHVVGYTGEVGEEEVGLLKGAGQKYEVGDLAGRMGLEQEYEGSLRGLAGGRLVEVDNVGQVVRELGRRDPVPGAKLYTTIDAGIQRAAYEALNLGRAIPRYKGVRKGAVVVTDPKTGEVLAMVSSPSFDPAAFMGEADRAREVQEVLEDKNMPLLNRAIGGVYAPGSTFKLATMTAAMESGKVEPDFTFTDTGVITVGDFRYTNWLFTKRGLTEGAVGFVRALARSTDTFFYKVGELTGPETMAEWAARMGLGAVTGVDLPGEVTGLIATPEWKEKEKGERWFLGNTYHMAIGQGDILVTPVQINVMTNVVATGGQLCRPHIWKADAGECVDIGISSEVLDMVRQGMAQACSPGGTAFPLFDFRPPVGCKTGTAEYMDADGKVRSHGWLTAYAPATDPAVTVTVLVEGGGEGSNVAAPIVRMVLAKYFGVEDSYNYLAVPQQVGE